MEMYREHLDTSQPKMSGDIMVFRSVIFANLDAGLDSG